MDRGSLFNSRAPYPMPYERLYVVKSFVKLSEKDGIPEFEYCLEELAELIQAIQKLKRARKLGRKKSYISKAKQHLIEEIAHVYLTLNHIREQENISVDDIQIAMNEKIEKWGFRN